MTQARLKELFNYEAGKLIWAIQKGLRGKLGAVAGSLNKSIGYYEVQFDKKQYLAHRVIFMWHHGYLPEFIDHINGIRTDNRIENLRAATRHDNSRNKSSAKNSTSKYLGVWWSKFAGKWTSRIYVGTRQIHLGYFKEEADAAQAYNFAAYLYCPDTARFNVADAK